MRRQVGYGRYNSKAAYELLGKLYPLLCLQMNFFRPLRKLVSKHRQGSKSVKRYDEPRTPYQRLLASGLLAEPARSTIDLALLKLNPAELQRQIEHLLHQLWQHTDHKKGERLANAG